MMSQYAVWIDASFRPEDHGPTLRRIWHWTGMGLDLMPDTVDPPRIAWIKSACVPSHRYLCAALPPLMAELLCGIVLCRRPPTD